IDVIKKISQGVFAVEWETGNISSSHRALNKIAVGIIQNSLIGGILILPKRSLAQFLTDRIGNYEEISPYFTLYQHLDIQNGFIGIIAVNYDEINTEVSIIPKGKDGNAMK
ncbi:PDDEXK family nuclease, partial [Phocaeicola dorei]